ncbi:MAG: hypothetical protein J6S33_04570 [Aeriscardovia sp.]|nr:hypothetical protein [Aeriscardovia sp.]
MMASSISRDRFISYAVSSMAVLVPSVVENAARGVRPARGSPRVGVSWRSMGFTDSNGSIVFLKATDTPSR